jgi:hypothetical protein
MRSWKRTLFSQGFTDPAHVKRVEEMMTIADEITAHLQPLVGLELSIARRAADMRVFHFGRIRKVEKGTVGDYALHIQCPWRLEDETGGQNGGQLLTLDASVKRQELTS